MSCQRTEMLVHEFFDVQLVPQQDRRQVLVISWSQSRYWLVDGLVDEVRELILKEQPTFVVFDFRYVTDYVSSWFLKTIVAANDQVGCANVFLAALGDRLNEGLTQSFPKNLVFQTLEEAINHAASQ